MKSDTRLEFLLPSSVRHLPSDFAFVLGLTVLTAAVTFTPGVRETPLRPLFVLAFLLFIPGYAVISALFPEAAPDEGDDSTWQAIDTVERVGLSFGVSVVLVPFAGLLLSFTPFGLDLLPLFVSFATITVVFTAVAGYRRTELPADERYDVSFGDWTSHVRAGLLEPESGVDVAVNVFLVVAFLIFIGSVGYAITPSAEESYTEFYLLTESTDGTLTASNYPDQFVTGERKTLVFGIKNYEHRPVQYSVVIELHQVDPNGGEVTDRQEINRIRTQLGHNETFTRPHAVTPSMTGERLRLTYMLYRGPAPSDPSVSSAYRETHLWISVS